MAYLTANNILVQSIMQVPSNASLLKQLIMKMS